MKLNEAAGTDGINLINTFGNLVVNWLKRTLIIIINARLLRHSGNKYFTCTGKRTSSAARFSYVIAVSESYIPIMYSPNDTSIRFQTK